jgi:4-diphosphocytidyl-2-C-methyl-D-erythritol kinase
VSDTAIAGAAAGVTRLARAKLNLTLRIVGKRADGYHLLDSLVAFAEYGDHVTARRAANANFTLDGPFSAALASESDNLVLRAKHALAEAAEMPPSLVEQTSLALDKHLPVASGIGGGSADAAATIEALTALWHVSLPLETLRSLALKLGADVPVCLAGEPCHMTGIGEHLAPVTSLPPAALVLVNPLMPCPTGPVFKARQGAFSAPLDDVPAPRNVTELAALIARGGNDLENPATSLCPPIALILASLRGSTDCLAAAMSGSGATCFGLFPDDHAAQTAASRIAAAEPGWWVIATRLAV